MKTIISEISKTYAKSLAEISTEQNCDELYLKQLYEISEIFNKLQILS